MSNVEVAPVFGYGEGVERAGVTARVGTVGEVEKAPIGVPYQPKHRPDHLCRANDNTCKGPKAKGTDYCVGHLRARGEL